MTERIAQITDLHLGESHPSNNGLIHRKRFDRVIIDITKNNITQVVCTGDIGVSEELYYFFDRLKNMNVSITLGNHDSFDKIVRFYKTGADYQSQKIYSSTTKKAYKIIYLDSSSGVIDDKQFNWLKRELYSTKPIIIFTHYPILRLNFKVDDVGKLKNRYFLTSYLSSIPNSVYIYCGHYHMESTIVYNNITQHITPAIAFQIKKSNNQIEIDNSFFGYRIIEIGINKHYSSLQLFNHAD